MNPPPTFLPSPGPPAAPWEQWIEAFETYLEVIVTKDMTEEKKLAILKHNLGLEGQAQFKAIEKLKLESDAAAVGDSVYRQAVARLSQRFQVKRNLSVRRSEFFKRKQEAGEFVEEFISALRRLMQG